MNRIAIVKNTILDEDTMANSTYAGKTGDLTTQIAGLSEANLLAQGSIALFHQTGALVSPIDVLDSSISPDYMILAVGNKAGVRTTYVRKNNVKATTSAYTPAIAKIVGIGEYESGLSPAPSTGFTESGITAGDEFIIKMTKPQLGYYDDIDNTRFFNVILDNKTLALAATKMEAMLIAMTAKLNASEWADVTAVTYYSAGTGGIKITSKTAGNDFDIKLIEKWAYSPVTVVTENVVGVGTYSHMLQLEKESTQEDGNTDIWGYTNGMGGLPSDVIDTTYNVVNIDYVRPSTHSPNAKSFDDTNSMKIAFAISGDNNDDGNLWTSLAKILNFYGVPTN